MQVAQRIVYRHGGQIGAGGAAGEGAAFSFTLGRINAVRASHGLSDLNAADMAALMLERDKELFTMGLRLPDQRRFDTWHLGADTWPFFPITQSERNGNDNF